MVALANPVEVVHPFEFRGARGARTGAECMEPLHEKFPKRLCERAELLLCRGGHENCGDRLVQSEPQFFQDHIQ